MPMVTVCPGRPDLNSLFFNLLDANPEWISEDDVTEAERIIFRKATRDSVREVGRGPDQKKRPGRFFDQCRRDVSSNNGSDVSLAGTTEECRFAALLAALANPTVKVM